MLEDKKILVLGSNGLVGSSLVRLLTKKYPDCNLLLPRRKELDLLDTTSVTDYFLKNKPNIVFVCAAKVGGIKANNDNKANFIRENLLIAINTIHNAWLSKVTKLIFLGSSCIYPKNSPQPIKEEYLLSGHLEESNDAYAISKIAGINMCQSYNKQYGCNYISVMPTNLYGPNDNFDPINSHVIPGLINKFDKAIEEKSDTVEIWGTGTPRREFLHVDDLAEALIFLAENYDDPSIINVGTGKDISIKDLSLLLKDVTGFNGEIIFNPDYPDGTPRKLLDITKIETLGWKPSIDFTEGLKNTYLWYKTNKTDK